MRNILKTQSFVTVTVIVLRKVISDACSRKAASWLYFFFFLLFHCVSISSSSLHNYTQGSTAEHGGKNT